MGMQNLFIFFISSLVKKVKDIFLAFQLITYFSDVLPPLPRILYVLLHSYAPDLLRYSIHSMPPGRSLFRTVLRSSHKHLTAFWRLLRIPAKIPD